ncbi:MAG TPA: hypothetical protein VF366_04485 [Dehalococcoidia bacterium]
MKCSSKSGWFAHPPRLAALILVAAIFLVGNCSPPKGDGFAIYLTKGDIPPAQMPVLSHVDIVEPPVISINDVITYNTQTHELKLTTSAFERISELDVPVQGKSFVICVDRQPAYWGAFWTPLSSMSFNGVTILKPTSLDGSPVIRLELGYPSSSFYTGEDPRNNPELLISLEQAGKLTGLSIATADAFPHSMKGYELYSWSQDGQWHFTLITGTNRNKTPEEIISNEDIISEDGWVQIHVAGVDAVKAALGKLPPGEEILWLARPRAEQTPPGNINFALPPEPTIDNIKADAEQHGLNLLVEPLS